MNHFINFLLFTSLYLTAVILFFFFFFRAGVINSAITLFSSVVNFPLIATQKVERKMAWCSAIFLILVLFQGPHGPEGKAGSPGRLGSQGHKVGHFLKTYQNWIFSPWGRVPDCISQSFFNTMNISHCLCTPARFLESQPLLWIGVWIRMRSEIPTVHNIT